MLHELSIKIDHQKNQHDNNSHRLTYDLTVVWSDGSIHKAENIDSDRIGELVISAVRDAVEDLTR